MKRSRFNEDTIIGIHHSQKGEGGLVVARRRIWKNGP
jgi:hypothetical protein